MGVGTKHSNRTAKQMAYINVIKQVNAPFFPPLILQVRQFVLLHGSGRQWERAARPGSAAQIRGVAGQVLWKCECFQPSGSKGVLPVGGGERAPEDGMCFMCINSTTVINVLLVMASNAPRRLFKWVLNQGELVSRQKSIWPAWQWCQVKRSGSQSAFQIIPNVLVEVVCSHQIREEL